MELSFNQALDFFSKSDLQFVNIFSTTLSAGQQEIDRKTSDGLCGLIIPISGKAHVSLNQCHYSINEQVLIHAGSSMDLDLTTNNDFTYAVIHYRILRATDSYEQMLHQHFSISIDDATRLFPIIEKMVEYQLKADPLSKFQLRVLFINLLESIVMGSRNNQPDFSLLVIHQAVDYIHKHYTEEILVSELATIFHLERRKFSSLFEQVTGFTPIHYLTKYRLSHAKDLLTLSNLPISDIAESIGYPDHFYFSRVFKKHEGMSPSVYRKQQKKCPYSAELYSR